MIAWVVALLFTTPMADAAGTPTPESRPTALVDAQRDFDQGLELRTANPTRAAESFRAAADGFEGLIATGVENGRLYYNLGNAYMMLDDPGRAILNYRRAQRLIPGDAQLDANLRAARRRRMNQFETSGQTALLHTLFFWHYDTPLRSRVTVGVVLYVLLWTMAIAALYVHRVRWRYALVPTAALCVIVGASVATDAWLTPRERDGVILADETVVRKGNGVSYEPQFNEPLHAGAEFEIKERRGRWLRIELPDGKSGWIEESAAEIV
jgi:tetratricopeptide (TPR) repeat protein